jgi:hypothetical protein
MTVKLFRILLLNFIVFGHFNGNAQLLNRRVIKYSKALNLRPISQEEFISKSKKFIDPHVNIDSVAQVVYNGWKCSLDNHEIHSDFKIERIIKLTSKKRQVVISRIVEYENGEIYSLKTKSTWIRFGTKWYRTSSAPELIENKKL